MPALTIDHVRGFLDPAAAGDWAPFIAAIEPDVHWMIASPVRDLDSAQGVYNLAEWVELVSDRLAARLDSKGLRMSVESIEIVGQKAIVEAYGTSTQLNGKPYHNNYCWILYVSEETGKIFKITEYMNTALVKEVLAAEPA